MDGHNARRLEPDDWNFVYAGAVAHFFEAQFDVNVVGNDFPGEGSAGTSGDCNHNFISATWTTNNEISVDTASPVPACYLTDARHPDGIPKHTEDVISVIGSTKLSVFIENHVPRTLTFLVVATDFKVETVDTILNYDELDLDQAKFYVPCGPRPPSCELAPCEMLCENRLDPVPQQNSIVVATIHTTLVPPPGKRVTQSQSVSTTSDP